MADVVAVLRASIGDFTAKMAEARGEMDKTEKSGSTSFSKLGGYATAGAAAIAASAVAFGTVAVKMGMEGQATTAQLQNAFKNAGTSLDAYKGQVDFVDQGMTRLGFTNDTTNAALARLITVTGNAKESLSLMGLAADIARARHIDLSSATDLLAKTMAGNLTAAKRMGIEIPPEISKIKDPTQKANDILAILEGRFKGSAAAAAGTFQGKVATMRAEVSNLTERIGTALIPILEKVVTFVTKAVDWFSKHKEAAVAVGIALGGVVIALTAFSVAATIAAAAEAAVLWPVLLIGAGLALLGFAAFELATHWQQVWTDIKNWVNDAWQYIKPIWDFVYQYLIGPLVDSVKLWINIFKQAFSDAKQWVKDAWDNVIKPVWDFINQYLIGPMKESIQDWIIIFKLAWNDAKTVVQAAWDDVLKPVWGLIKDGIGYIKDAINDLNTAWDGVWGGLEAVVSQAWSDIKPILNTIIGGINDVIDGANSASGLLSFGQAPKIPDIPTLKAAGGPVSANTPYIVGERGPELFIPSGAGGNIVPNNQLGGGPSGPITVHIDLNGQTFAQAIWPDLWSFMLQQKRSEPSLGLA